LGELVEGDLFGGELDGADGTDGADELPESEAGSSDCAA